MLVKGAPDLIVLSMFLLTLTITRKSDKVINTMLWTRHCTYAVIVCKIWRWSYGQKSNCSQVNCHGIWIEIRISSMTRVHGGVFLGHLCLNNRGTSWVHAFVDTSLVTWMAYCATLWYRPPCVTIELSNVRGCCEARVCMTRYTGYWLPANTCSMISVNTFSKNYPESEVYGAKMGPTWGRQDPGGPHVGPINLAI